MSVCVSGWVELAKTVIYSLQQFKSRFTPSDSGSSTFQLREVTKSTYTVMYTSNTVNKKKFVCLIIVYNGSLLTEGKSQN